MPLSPACFVASPIRESSTVSLFVLQPLAAGRAALLARAFGLVARALALALRARPASHARAAPLARRADVAAVTLIPAPSVRAHNFRPSLLMLRVLSGHARAAHPYAPARLCDRLRPLSFPGELFQQGRCQRQGRRGA